MRFLRFDGARMIDNNRDEAVPLADAAAQLLDRLRAEPLPAEPRTAAALRRATQAAFAILAHARRLTEPSARNPEENP